MNNLFDFEYQAQTLNNLDGSASRFGVVYGEDGNIIHTKKDSYTIVPTASMSQLGNTFIDKGYDVSSYVHKSGEVIGLEIDLGGCASKVGDKNNSAYIHLPNNGGGVGKLLIKETRLICTNGMVGMVSTKAKNVRIPHNASYEQYIKIMEQSIIAFAESISFIEERDAYLNEQKLSELELRKLLNKWFFEYEMPMSHKKDMTFNQFRELLVTNPSEIKSYDRYEELMFAKDRELEYNSQLGLELSHYTFAASVSNYLSRRLEKSQSAAPKQVQSIRTMNKMKAALEVA